MKHSHIILLCSNRLVHRKRNKPKKTETFNTNSCCYSIKNNLWNKINKNGYLSKIVAKVHLNLYEIQYNSNKHDYNKCQQSHINP